MPIISVSDRDFYLIIIIIIIIIIGHGGAFRLRLVVATRGKLLVAPREYEGITNKLLEAPRV